MLDEFLKNELSFNRESGTYLFYGEDLEKNFELAVEFAKYLFSKNIKNLEDIENIKQKVDRQSYADLYIIDNLTIDMARDVIKKTYTSSHEGNPKVFILKNIQDIRKESANAILKIIEEPTKNNFFILLSNRLNILATIKSRSIVYRVKRFSAEDLDIDRYTYEFFMSSSVDIREFKNTDISLSEEKSFKDIARFIKDYESEKKLEQKVNIYKALRDFVSKSVNLEIYDKVKFAEDIYMSISNKENIKLIVDYLINLVKRDRKLKNKLYLKKMLRYPVNMKLSFINLVLDI
ncbi:DNA polymerase III subunit delta' [Fusobacterium russii]|uniref:DNA polymerase III subunit delta' n=1 Tax=Fusobacterium russii TaxID=854 RepID=UPI00039C83C1|nr:DNA polymerase III subunit delta' [Fusobacterium russii]